MQSRFGALSVAEWDVVCKRKQVVLRCQAASVANRNVRPGPPL